MAERRLTPRQRSVLRVLSETGPHRQTPIARQLWPASGRRKRGVVAMMLAQLRQYGFVERTDDGRHRVTDEGLRALRG